MTPQLADLNGDGINDMVMATFEGTAFLVEGTGDGFLPPKHILDSEGSMVRISYYWDLEAEEYKSVDRSAEGEEYHEDHHLTSIALVDWEQDGDLDLILGAYEGALYYCLNEGSATAPSFSKTTRQLLAGGKHAGIEGGLATPRICDWNDDGLFDIICGSAGGGVIWFPNQGERGEPKFGAAQTLVARSRTGDLAEEGESSESAYYRNLYAPEKNGWPAHPAKSCHVEIVDYDRDGRKDLLLGGQAWLRPEAKELTEDEEKELAGLAQKIEDARQELIAIVEKLGNQEDLKKAISESDEYQETVGKYQELQKRQRDLSREPPQFDLIWLYRNVSGSPKANSGPADRTEDKGVEPAPSGSLSTSDDREK